MSSTAKSVAYPDFSNTKIAFQNKSDSDLKEIERLFKLMNHKSLVSVGSAVAKCALKFKLPLVELIIKKTLFKQFCGGLNLMDCQDMIDDLYKNNTLSLLDYGVEAKSEESELDEALDELLSAIEFAASNHSVPAAICKLTSLVPNQVLIKKQKGTALKVEEEKAYGKFYKRVESAVNKAYDLKTSIFIDAEESWMQDPMDQIVTDMMAKYNKDRVVVYNTYQMYRKDRLQRLKDDYEKSRSGSYFFGAKLVRGAYMDKERERAIEMGYPSPIHETKNDTDRDFDAGIAFCLDHYQHISFVCATHNIRSTELLAQAVIDRGIPLDHPHINFSQLQGMSDYITFNLAKSGFNVAKYVVYGPVKDVTEYLIRRAEENTAVTGEVSRELRLIQEEIKRRGI
jgi:proline dehydrogenase